MLERLIERYPEGKWNWRAISENENFTMEMFIKYEKKRHLFNSFHISRYMKLTLDFIDKYKEFKWDWVLLSANPSFTIEELAEMDNIRWDFVSMNLNFRGEHLLKYPDKKWSMYHVSKNPSLDLNFVLKYHLFRWSHSGLAQNPNITRNFFENYPHFNKLTTKLNMNEISRNINITLDFLLKYKYLLWNFGEMSSNPYLNIDILKYFKNRMWNWDIVTRHKNIKMSDIAMNDNLSWKMQVVLGNPNASSILYIPHHYSKLNILYLMRNYGISLDEIYKFLYYLLRVNHEKAMRIAHIHFEKIWEREDIPHFTFKPVNKVINFDMLSANSFRITNKIMEEKMMCYAFLYFRLKINRDICGHILKFLT